MSEKVFRLYDTLTKQAKPLTLKEPGHLRFYTCGPTVYSYAHIGNFRSFLTSDLIVRTAQAIGWKVSWVSNITDVGHLTQDDFADAGGEDKMEKALKSKEGEQFSNVWELAEYYTNAFIEDWNALNLSEPLVRPKATQHVREQILATESLIENGHAYETPTGVYFSVESFPKYGELSGNTQDQLFSGTREVVLDDNKKQQADFALWKKDDKHLMQWFSPFGWGFPGWHIECSAMARRYLGDTLDLHSGGEDNIFPHHECEIAQSESLTGKPFCTHWVHTRFLQVNGQKMSKSAGNFYTVRMLMAKGFDPLAIRFALISAAFTKQLNFTDQGLSDAQGNIERFRRADELVNAAILAEKIGPNRFGAELDDLYEDAVNAMLNDLNTSVALAKALEGAKIILREEAGLGKESAENAKSFLDRINALLGVVRQEGQIVLSQPTQAPSIDEQWVLQQIEDRATAKREKRFAHADAIRDELIEKGIELRDSPEGTTWHLRTRMDN